MRTLGKWLLAFGLIATSAAAGRSADPEKIYAREGAVELVLLRQQSVQDELKLTKDQVQKIEAFGDAQWKKAQEIHKLDAEKAKAQFVELGKENEKFIAETLKPEQQKRLNQIAMQVAGLIWALDPRVAREIKLTDDQKKKIEELHKAAHKELEEVLHAPDRTQRAAKLDQLRAEHRKQLAAVLTDEQKAKWKELAGEPFKGKLQFVELEKGKP